MRALSVGFRLWPPVWVVLCGVVRMLLSGASGMHVWARLELSIAASIAILDASPAKIRASNSVLPLFRRIKLSGHPQGRLVISHGAVLLQKGQGGLVLGQWNRGGV